MGVLFENLVAFVVVFLVAGAMGALIYKSFFGTYTDERKYKKIWKRTFGEEYQSGEEQ